MNILFDVDGVLRDTVPTILKIYKRDFDPSCKLEYKNMIHYDMRQLPKITDKYNQLFIPYAKELFLESPLIDKNSPKIIKNLKSDGHKIFIATHQSHELEHYTDEWLDKHKIYPDELYYTEDKHKIPNFDIGIEDFIRNLDFIKGIRRTAICFDQPYNKDWEDRRIFSLNELKKEIINIEHFKSYCFQNSSQ